MAIYFYRLNDLQVDKIIATHETTITSVSWSPQNSQRFASVGLDGVLYIWDIEKETTEAKLFVGGIPLQCEFSYYDNEILIILLTNGI